MVDEQDIENMDMGEDVVMEPPKKQRKKRKSRKLLVLFLFLAIAAAAFYYLRPEQLPQLIAQATQTIGFASQSPGTEKMTAELPSLHTPIPAITVNLISGNGQDEFIKVSAVLEYDDEELQAIIDQRRIRITDGFTSLLRNLRLTDIKGSAGTQLLREELTRRANIALHPYKINTVRFEEIVIQ